MNENLPPLASQHGKFCKCSSCTGQLEEQKPGFAKQCNSIVDTRLWTCSSWTGCHVDFADSANTWYWSWCGITWQRGGGGGRYIHLRMTIVMNEDDECGEMKLRRPLCPHHQQSTTSGTTKGGNHDCSIRLSEEMRIRHNLEPLVRLSCGCYKFTKWTYI